MKNEYRIPRKSYKSVDKSSEINFHATLQSLEDATKAEFLGLYLRDSWTPIEWSKSEISFHKL